MNFKKILGLLTSVTLIGAFPAVSVSAAERNGGSADYGNMPMVDTSNMNEIENPTITWQNGNSNSNGYGTVDNAWTEDFVMSYDVKLSGANDTFRYAVFFGTRVPSFDEDAISKPKESGESKFTGRIGMCGPYWSAPTGEVGEDGNPVQKAAQWMTGYYENEEAANNVTYQAFGKNIGYIPHGKEISSGKTYNIYTSYQNKTATIGIKMINDGTNNITDSEYYWVQIPYTGDISRKGGISIYQDKFYGNISNLKVWADENVLASLDKTTCKVYKGTELTLTFTESILSYPQSVQLVSGENAASAAVEVTEDEKVFKLRFNDELLPNTKYTIALDEFLSVSAQIAPLPLEFTTDNGKMAQTDLQNMHKVEKPNLKFYKKNGDSINEPQYEAVFGVLEDVYAKDFVLKYTFDATRVADSRLYYIYFGADRDLLKLNNSYLGFDSLQNDKFISKVGYKHGTEPNVSWIGQYFTNENNIKDNPYFTFGYCRRLFEKPEYIKVGKSYDFYLSYVDKKMTFGIKRSEEDETGWVWYSGDYTGNIERPGTIVIHQNGICGGYRNLEVYTGEESYTNGITLDKTELKSGETVTATTKTMNYGENAEAPALLNALYKKTGNVWSLTDVSMNEKNGDISAEMTIPDDGGEYMIKAFLLKSMSKLTPLTEAVELQ